MLTHRHTYILRMNAYYSHLSKKELSAHTRETDKRKLLEALIFKSRVKLVFS